MESMLGSHEKNLLNVRLVSVKNVGFLIIKRLFSNEKDISENSIQFYHGLNAVIIGIKNNPLVSAALRMR